MNESYRHLHVEREGDVLVLTIGEKELCEYEVCAEVGNELTEAIKQSDTRAVVIDLCNVEFVTSVGVVPFLSANRCTRSLEGRLVLANLSEFVHQVFTVTRLLINPGSENSPFEWAPSRQQAIEMLRS